MMKYCDSCSKTSDDFSDKSDKLLDMVELAGREEEVVQNYSGGMKRRLEIARGLLHNPQVLFLDEPTLGLDPQTRRHIWDYLITLRVLILVLLTPVTITLLMSLNLV